MARDGDKAGRRRSRGITDGLDGHVSGVGADEVGARTSCDEPTGGTHTSRRSTAPVAAGLDIGCRRGELPGTGTSRPRDPQRTKGWVIGRVSGAPVILTPSWFLAAAVLTVLFAPTVRSFAPASGSASTWSRSSSCSCCSCRSSCTRSPTQWSPGRAVTRSPSSP
ncbi:hypothetical protein NKG05_29260 [Oerskovia sp. M15]